MRSSRRWARAGCRECPVRPAKAFYHPEKGEFFLMYDEVRLSENPAETLMEFCQNTYEAGAIAGKWDRASLERDVKTATKAGAR